MTYSSTLAMNRQRSAVRSTKAPNNAWGKNRNTTLFDGQAQTLGPISNTIMLLILACVVGLLYLTQVTKTNAFGYKIDNLQKEQTSLQNEHDELEVASARLQSLERVKNSQVANALVPVSAAGTVQN